MICNHVDISSSNIFESLFLNLLCNPLIVVFWTTIFKLDFKPTLNDLGFLENA